MISFPNLLLPYIYSHKHPILLYSVLRPHSLSEMKKENLSTFLSLLLLSFSIKASAAAAPTLQIRKGFKANCDPSSTPFQPLLSDPTGVFSLGFLLLNSSQLDLAVVHLPSGDPLWLAAPAFPARWSASAFLYFDGDLIFSDPVTGLLWSTPTAKAGDRVVLLNSSNLQILKLAKPTSVLWQSFDFPSDTIVQGQNFTSTATLFSAKQRYTMRLGSNYIGLFMEFGRGAGKPMYWKRTALEEKNQIIDGKGPIYAQVSPIGFLGLYQKEKKPVDVLTFDSFNRGISGFRRMTLEADGNLKSYYWNGTLWVDDYAAITELCQLPSGCGAYGFCISGAAPQCGCIDNSTDRCPPEESGDLCGRGDEFRVLRRKGVDLGNKELLGFVKVGDLEDCEGLCERNCSCWGAIYNNATGYCYRMDYPVETVVGVGDEGKMGYFKVRNVLSGNEGDGGKGRLWKGVVVVVVVAAVAVVSGGVGIYRLWRVRRWRRGGVDGSMVEGLAPGPYKDLNSSSFRTIELSESFRK